MRRFLAKAPAKQPKFWVLLVALLLQMVLNPCFLPLGPNLEVWGLLVLNSLVLLAILYRLSFRRIHFLVGLILAIPILILVWIPPEPVYVVPVVSLTGVLYLYTMVVCFFPLARAKEVSIDEVAGGCALYLLLGMTWAFLYQLVEYIVPGSFKLSVDEVPILADLIYFSFTTVTTLGYGDIAPVSCEARVLSNLETISGLLVLSLVIGRIVSIHTAQTLRERHHSSIRADKKELSQ